MVENKKKSMVPFLSIIIILLFGVIIVLLLDKNNSKESGESTNNGDFQEQNVVDKDFDLEDAKELIDLYVLKDYSVEYKVFEEKLTDVDKVLIAIQNSDDADIDYDCNDMADGGVNEGHGVYYYDDEDGQQGVCSDSIVDGEFYKEYKFSDVSNTYKEMFGKELKPIDYVYVGTYRYVYSEKYNAYIGLSCECGGRGYIYIKHYEIEDLKIIDDQMSITVGYLNLFVDEDPDKDNSLDDFVNVYHEDIKDIFYENVDYMSLDKEKIYKEHKEKLPKYVFEFKKHTNGDGYYLVNIEAQK